MLWHEWFCLSGGAYSRFIFNANLQTTSNPVVHHSTARVFQHDVARPLWCFPLSNVSATEVGVRLGGAGGNGVGESIIVWRRGGAFPPWLHTIMPGAKI